MLRAHRAISSLKSSSLALSVERLKHHYEQQWMANQLSADLYHQHRTAVERLAVATFVRLWDALDRRLFTSDPSPWNVLVHQPDAMLGSQPVATIIDLHGLEDDVGLTYVVQRLAAVYGMRQDILENVLIPGVFDALGVAAGTALLRAALPASRSRGPTHAAEPRRRYAAASCPSHPHAGLSVCLSP
jgi:hypothetical protein